MNDRLRKGTDKSAAVSTPAPTTTHSTQTDRALSGKHVVLGVSGSIAAYKAADIASKLVQAGATVDVTLTKAATSFVGPLTFQGLTHRAVLTDLIDPRSELGIDHVALAKRADVMLIAPATANTIAALAHGFADDALTTTALATEAPIIVCPAMESHMYAHPAIQANLALLRERGVVVVEPEFGRLASGLSGVGRLADPSVIIGTVRLVLGRDGDLAGRRIVVSAGGTREPIDPVRFVANRSSGKMGHAIAAAARDRGARVTLVTTAAVDAETSVGIAVRHVDTALEMQVALREALAGGRAGADSSGDPAIKTAEAPADPAGAVRGADVLIMAAAVADYRPATVADRKLKKQDQDGDGLTLQLVRNPDILAETTEPVLKIGFAAETDDLLANARAKLEPKGLDMIVANDVSEPDSGFGTDTNRVVLVHASGDAEPLPVLPKVDVAHELLDRVRALLDRAASHR